MTTPNRPTSELPQPEGVVPLDLDLGLGAGHRVVLLSLECWSGWADLRFARIDTEATHRLTRRVPPADAWRIRADGDDLQVFDAVGRGDRTFSNGEVRVVPAPRPGQHLEVSVDVAGTTLAASFTLDDPSHRRHRPDQ